MTTSNPSKGQIPGQQANNPTAKPLPPFASTLDEIRQAVADNSVRRGRFILNNLHAQGFDYLIQQVAILAESTDVAVWSDNALGWGISQQAMEILDTAQPPVRYPYYLCNPQVLIDNPRLIKYYRNVAMVSQKVMRGIGLDTTSYEKGKALNLQFANELTSYFNKIISSLVVNIQITPERHLEMAYSNLGDSFGGIWRNEVGRLAYVQILTPLVLKLHAQGYVKYIQYSLKGRIVRESEAEEDQKSVSRRRKYILNTDQVDFLTELERLHEERIVYREIGLHNGNKLLLNRQITLKHPVNNSHAKIGPDLLSVSDQQEIYWVAELKGGADPAGSDEHWKTAKSALDRIQKACRETGRPEPPASFLATILVERVATDAEEWINDGKLISVYNLTQIAENPTKREAFLNDLAGFLGCPTGDPSADSATGV